MKDRWNKRLWFFVKRQSDWLHEIVDPQIDHFENRDFWPKREWPRIAILFLAWSVPAFLFVLWAYTFEPDVEYYKKAIDQGVGIELWNVIGSIVFFCFGIALILSRWLTKLHQMHWLWSVGIATFLCGLIAITSLSVE